MAISVGGAVGAGFSLIGRRPWSVLGWGVFTYLAVVVLVGIMIAVLGLSAFAAFPRLGVGAPAATPADVARLLGTIWPMFVVLIFGQLLISSVTQAAVFRSVLRPDDRAFFSLRVGVEEGVLFLLYLVFAFFVLLAYIVVFVAVVAAAALGHAIGGFLGGLVAFLLIVASVLAMMWVFTRLALAAPMSFAERRVRFFGAWALTRGEGWRMFGLAWLLGLIASGLFIAYYIVSIIISLILIGVGAASMGLSAGGQNIAQNPAALAAMWPMLALFFLVYLVLGSAFIGAFQTILLAPWADAYRQLRGSPDVAATFS